MRRGLIAVTALLAGLAWWQRAAIETLLHPPKPPGPVYSWTDSQGQRHYGDNAPPGAQQVQLKPLNTVKGMTPAEIAAANQPKPAATAAQTPACDTDDPVANARCNQANATPRNLALERMEKMADQLHK